TPTHRYDGSVDARRSSRLPPRGWPARTQRPGARSSAVQPHVGANAALAELLDDDAVSAAMNFGAHDARSQPGEDFTQFRFGRCHFERIEDLDRVERARADASLARFRAQV